MSLVRWDPFADVESMFNRMLPRAARLPRFGQENGGGKMEWSPSADISETEKEFVIRAELPAVRKEDVQVLMDEGTITIKGERKQQSEDKNEKFHRVESFYGSFERSFSLPDNVKTDAVHCESKDGILTVHIPKTTQTKSTPRQIAVQ
jgi:HSP20 family protein